MRKKNDIFLEKCIIFASRVVHVRFSFTVVWLGTFFKRNAGERFKLGVFRAPRCVFFVFNDAEPFMLERVEGDDQLSFCLGAN